MYRWLLCRSSRINVFVVLSRTLLCGQRIVGTFRNVLAGPILIDQRKYLHELWCRSLPIELRLRQLLALRRRSLLQRFGLVDFRAVFYLSSWPIFRGCGKWVL